MAGQHEHDALLAAFLEATNKIDLRALRKHAAGVAMPQPVINIEAQVETAAAAMLDVATPTPAVPAFSFRRANLIAGS
jgi:hypothetical protein